MKKLFLLILCFLSGFTAIAQESTRYTTVDLNLRADTTLYSNVVTVLPKGTPVTLAEDCDCKWIPVYFQGQTGYVSAKYLSKTAPQKKHTATAKPQGKTKYYTNSTGKRIQSPTYFNSTPEGATALCRDGTYSFSRSRRGTCSHHGGVARWF